MQFAPLGIAAPFVLWCAIRGSIFTNALLTLAITIIAILAITYGLGNLIENAADFATTRVDVEARWSASEITITVRDDGPGFSQDIIDRLGDPFVTSRKGYGPGDPGDAAGRHEGMGLGFFIAKTLLERTGAQVTFYNGKPRGAVVSARWARATVEVV